MLREAGFEGVRVRHLVNANNLAGSIRYRAGRTGTTEPGGTLKALAALEAAGRTAGRISAEAVALPPAAKDRGGRR
jgi:hypothetical protein